METRGENRKFGAKCFIENNGKVNCSDIIYEDEKSWKLSRVQIDLLIKVLKNKISDLKDIKKHLKEHKPVHMKDYDEIPSVEDDDVTKDSRPILRKHNHQSNFNHGILENQNFENRTADSGEQKQVETTSSATNKNRNIDQESHLRINTTAPRLHNSHHRTNHRNRSHWNSSRPHHGKKVNLEDLFADNKSKDRITTAAPTTTTTTSDIVSSSYSSTSKTDTEPDTETTRNYFDGLESSTNFNDDVRTEAPGRRKVSYEISGKFNYFKNMFSCLNFNVLGSTNNPRTDNAKLEHIPEDTDDADDDFQEKKSSCLCADPEM